MTNGIYWLWLATRPRCSARFCGHLLERFGSPEAIWRAEQQEFEDIPRLNKVKMDSLMEKDLTVAQHIEETCRKQDIQIVTLEDERYPQLLREIPDPPLVLYVRGTLPDFTDRVSVSIVGTRKCTRYGKQAAWHFAGNLAQRGVIIVSGMAIGIDGTANRAAIEAGGETVAVLGCGVDVCYPWQHKQLMDDIMQHGAVISEYPPGTEPKGTHFPVRNRIITGLGKGTLIVEAPKKSGALISADLALEQGRDVYAVPGSVLSTDFAGTNDLINDGAYVVTQPVQLLSGYAERYHLDLDRVPSVQQLLAAEQDPGANLPQTSKEYDFERLEEGRQRLKKRRENQALLTAAESAVLAALPEVFTPVDQVAAKAAMPQGQLLAALTKLELLDLAESAPGSRFRKK